MRATTTAFLHRVAQVAALILPAPLSPPLRAAHAELRRSLHLAFRLASTHHRTVVLEPCREALCLRLDLSGSVELLRYRPLLGAWTAC